MAGNIAEWIHDHYIEDAYTAAGQTDPVGVAMGRLHVERGGGFSTGSNRARVSDRDVEVAHIARRTIGFRLVRTAH